MSVSCALLLCADPLRPVACDPHFAGEAAAAREAGAVVGLVDHDALLAGRAEEAVRRVPRDLGPAWYRGWMIPAPAYASLATVLAARGTRLLTTPPMYRTAHELPGWYAAFTGLTPPTTYAPCAPHEPPALAALASLTAALPSGAGLVKDYVKSRKHEWDEACHLPDLADTEAVHRVVSRFVELQGDDLTGGVVLRAFEPFDHAVGEARVWWLDGAPLLTTPHPDTPDLRPAPPLDALRPLVAALPCRFVTTDLARRTDDGTWRLVELGDAQVSGLPSGTDPALLLAPLLRGPA
ncbi:ATP-grasp domain-containing protein [Streptomyces xanthii]|uniref:ATP-grasp domain-containing protein n=1 Tax=Streptomyces xanthii TaxID=2768069 RepID=A0A7H1B8E3_9ACTN|nr:ATP-grasp domain-containing protein [Streptomyces xanthii]QNS04998.1 ATP-grasp domain-containing protein [Streptomyces xanthii]